MKFSNHIFHHLNYYVYIYTHPVTEEIFYIGKGKGNRAFSHLKDKSESRKVKYIENLKSLGLSPKIEILIHGLPDETTALKVESSIIDLIGLKALTNGQNGFKSGIFGRMTVDQIKAVYNKEEIQIIDPVIIIRISKAFRYSMPEQELYDYTRGRWKLNPKRAQKAKYAFAVYHGIIQEVYEIFQWHPAGTTQSSRQTDADHGLNSEGRLPGRYEFTGRPAPEEIRSKYRLMSIEHYFNKGNSNPIMYANL